MFQRYAVYYAPEPHTPLSRFAAAWFGHRSPGATSHTPRETLGLPEELVERATRGPSRYGMHATLKAPFRLADGSDERQLAQEVRALAKRLQPARTGPLEVARLGDFVAMIATGDTSGADAVAAACVTELDHLRAPLTDAERAHRQPSRLDDKERAHLERWGYPHVLDRFRLHITVSDRLPQDEGEAVAAAISRRLKPILAQPFEMAAICLFGDPGDARPFVLLERFRLGD